MKDVILWSLWYGVLVTVPSLMTRLLIKNAMVKAVTHRRVSSSMKRRSEVRHGIL